MTRNPRSLLAVALFAAGTALADEVQRSIVTGDARVVEGQGLACHRAGAGPWRVRIAWLQADDGRRRGFLDLDGRVVVAFHGEEGGSGTAGGAVLSAPGADGRATLDGALAPDCRLRAELRLSPSTNDDVVRVLAELERAATLEGAIERAQATAAAGHPVVALSALTGAIAAYEAAGGPSTLQLARARLAAARLALSLDVDDGTVAAAMLDAAEPAVRAGVPADDLLALRLRADRASLVRRNGEFSAAERERAALGPALRAALTEDDPEVIRNDIEWHWMLKETGERERALVLSRATYARSRERLGPADPVTLLGCEILAWIAFDLERFDEADARVAECLAAAVDAHGSGHPLVMRMLKRRAAADAQRGRPAEALPVFRRLYVWSAAELGEDNLNTINAAEWLGYVLQALDRPEEAAAERERAARWLRIRLGEDHPRTITATNNLALAYLLMGRLQPAIEMLEQTAAAAQARYGADHYRTAQIRETLAQALRADGRDAQSCAIYDELILFVRAPRAQPDLLRVDVTLGWARCRLDAGDVAAARDALEALHRGSVERNGAESVDAMRALAALAHAQLVGGESEAAGRSLDLLVEVAERRRAAESPDAGLGRTGFADMVAGREFLAGYRDLALLRATEGRADEAIRIAELARARSTSDALSLRIDAGDDLLPARDRNRLRDLVARRRELDAEIALLPPASTERTRLALARDAQDADIAALRARVAGSARQPHPFSADRARRALPAGVTFVSYQSVRGRAWVYVLRRDAAPAVVVLADTPGLADAVAALRTAMSVPDEKMAPIWKRADGRYVEALAAPAPGAVRATGAMVAAELSRALLLPIGKHLAGSRHLVIAADGALATLPYEVLPLAGKPLVATHDVGYAPSLAVFDALSRVPEKSPAGDLVAFGAPDYARLSGTAPGAGPLQGLQWAPLPGASAEVAAIAAEFPAGRSSVFDGAAATKANFAAANRRGLLERTRYLHVAAHGYLSAVAPQWSSLVLGGEGGAPAYVTAAELATYDIGARLVVLSACETALGRDVAGEGIFGLPYALTVAGARGTLLTLWPVADRSTSVFMTRFYRKLARGVPPATALARTKREFLRDPEWSAPLYWAPFVLYGR